MSHFGSPSNPEVVAWRPCPKCGATEGDPCTTYDEHGTEMHFVAVTHIERVPETEKAPPPGGEGA